MPSSRFPSVRAQARAGHAPLNAWRMGALAFVALAGLAFACGQAMAHNHDAAGHAGHGAAASAKAGAGTVLTEGEIRRRDERTGKLTIRHGEIANLAMAPMTMVFALQEPAQGSAFKPGDKVRFHVEKINGALVITHIEAAAD